jgi:hypothetical protein
MSMVATVSDLQHAGWTEHTPENEIAMQLFEGDSNSLSTQINEVVGCTLSGGEAPPPTEEEFWLAMMQACNNHMAATHVEQPENGTSDQPAQDVVAAAQQDSGSPSSSKVYHAIVMISSPVNEQQRLLDESNAGKVPLLDDSGATTLLTKSLYGLVGPLREVPPVNFTTMAGQNIHQANLRNQRRIVHHYRRLVLRP